MLRVAFTTPSSCIFLPDIFSLRDIPTDDPIRVGVGRHTAYRITIARGNAIREGRPCHLSTGAFPAFRVANEGRKGFSLGSYPGSEEREEDGFVLKVIPFVEKIERNGSSRINIQERIYKRPHRAVSSPKRGERGRRKAAEIKLLL